MSIHFKTEQLQGEIVPCAELGQVKCPRCYHYSYSMNFDNLCNRCVAILCKHFPDNEKTKLVLENIEQRYLSPQDNPEWNNV